MLKFLSGSSLSQAEHISIEFCLLIIVLLYHLLQILVLQLYFPVVRVNLKSFFDVNFGQIQVS
uniref:Transmembrane protein n=1 Tax=Medicago truncatula TaxID=3880 RepID=I3S9N3_MEDTR|nr:unknown [Medicago truncatula]